MNIIFDFDNTIFDTASFSRAIYKAVGLNELEASDSYVRNFSQLRRPYSFSEHLSILVSEGLLLASEMEAAMVAVDSVLQRSRDFVYPDAWSIFRFLQGRGDRVEILTMGDQVWQSQKLAHCGLLDYVQRLVVVRPPKSECLQSYELIDDLAFVNDNVLEIMEINRILPRAKCVLVEGKHARDIEHNLPIVALADILSRLGQLVDEKNKKNDIF